MRRRATMERRTAALLVWGWLGLAAGRGDSLTNLSAAVEDYASAAAVFLDAVRAADVAAASNAVVPFLERQKRVTDLISLAQDRFEAWRYAGAIGWEHAAAQADLFDAEQSYQWVLGAVNNWFGEPANPDQAEGLMGFVEEAVSNAQVAAASVLPILDVLAASNAPPCLRVTLDAPRTVFLNQPGAVRALVRNAGDQTARNVRLTLMRGAAQGEPPSRLTLGDLAGGEERLHAFQVTVRTNLNAISVYVSVTADNAPEDVDEAWIAVAEP